MRVSVLGFGCSPLGDEFGPIDEREAERAVHRAISLGINYFDVAPYYGRTLAEQRLGRILEGRRRRVLIATKAGRYGRKAPEGFDFSAERMRTSVEDSLRRLRTDVVDVLQVHDVEFGETERIIDETVPALEQLKREGKVRAVGITGYPLRNLRRIAEATDVDVVLSYCHYNLLNRRMDEVLTPLAREEGIGLINASPLFMGMLSEEEAPDWHPAPPAARNAAARARAICSDAGVRLPEVALHFATRHPDVSTTLVGMGQTRFVEENVGALGLHVDPGLVTAVEGALKPALGVEWVVGRPENNDREAQAAASAA